MLLGHSWYLPETYHTSFKLGRMLQKSLYLYIVGNEEEKGTKSGIKLTFFLPNLAPIHSSCSSSNMTEVAVHGGFAKVSLYPTGQRGRVIFTYLLFTGNLSR